MTGSPSRPRDAAGGHGLLRRARKSWRIRRLAIDYLGSGTPCAAEQPGGRPMQSGACLKVRASHPGTETALVLTSGGFSFLQLKRVERSSSERRRAEARAVADSFDPL